MSQAQNTGPQWEPESLDGILSLLDLVGRPGNAVRSAIVEAEKSGLGGNVLGAAGEGLSGQRLVDPTELPGMSNLPDNTLLQAGPVHLTPRTLGSFAAGTVTDPLTYLTAGLGKGIQAIPKIARAARPAMIASEAAQTGLGGLGGAALVGRDAETGEWDPGKTAGGFAAGAGASVLPGAAIKGIRSEPAQAFLKNESGELGPRQKFKRGSPEDLAQQAEYKKLYEAQKAQRAKPPAPAQPPSRKLSFEERERAVDAAEDRARVSERMSPAAIEAEYRDWNGELLDDTGSPTDSPADFQNALKRGSSSRTRHYVDDPALVEAERAYESGEMLDIDTEDLFAEPSSVPDTIPAPSQNGSLIGSPATEPIEKIRAELGGPAALRLHAPPGAQELAEKQYRALMDQLADTVGNPRNEWGPDNPALQPKLTVPKGTATLGDKPPPVPADPTKTGWLHADAEKTGTPPPSRVATPEQRAEAAANIEQANIRAGATNTGEFTDDFEALMETMLDDPEWRARVDAEDALAESAGERYTPPAQAYAPPLPERTFRTRDQPGPEPGPALGEGTPRTTGSTRLTRQNRPTPAQIPPSTKVPVRGMEAMKQAIADMESEMGIEEVAFHRPSDTGHWDEGQDGPSLPKGYEGIDFEDENFDPERLLQQNNPESSSGTVLARRKGAENLSGDKLRDVVGMRDALGKGFRVSSRGNERPTGMEGERFDRMVEADMPRFSKQELEAAGGNPVKTNAMRDWISNIMYTTTKDKAGKPIAPLYKRVAAAEKRKRESANPDRTPGYLVKASHEKGRLHTVPDTSQPDWQHSPEGRRFLQREALAIATDPKKGWMTTDDEATGQTRGMTIKEIAERQVEGKARVMAQHAHHMHPEGGRGAHRKYKPGSKFTDEGDDEGLGQGDTGDMGGQEGWSPHMTMQEQLGARERDFDPGDPDAQKRLTRQMDENSYDEDERPTLQFADEDQASEYYKAHEKIEFDEAYVTKLEKGEHPKNWSPQRVERALKAAKLRLDRNWNRIGEILDVSDARPEAMRQGGDQPEYTMVQRERVPRKPGKFLGKPDTFGEERPGATVPDPRDVEVPDTVEVNGKTYKTSPEVPSRTATVNGKTYKPGEELPSTGLARGEEDGMGQTAHERLQAQRMAYINRTPSQRTLEMSEKDMKAAARSLALPGKPRRRPQGPIEFEEPEGKETLVPPPNPKTEPTPGRGAPPSRGEKVEESQAAFVQRMAEIMDIQGRRRRGEQIWPNTPQHRPWIQYMQGRLQRMMEGNAA